MRADRTRPGLELQLRTDLPAVGHVFGTALYRKPPRPCGIDDARIDADNARGLLGQQGAALRRFAHALTRGPRAPAHPDLRG